MIDLPKKHFGAILADPPWHFQTWGEGGAAIARWASIPYCLDPRPLCWRCGKGGELRAVENVGWLCLDCQQQVAAAATELLPAPDHR